MEFEFCSSLDVSLPLYAVLDELIGRDSLAKLRAAAVDSLVQPTVRVNANSLEGEEGKQMGVMTV